MKTKRFAPFIILMLLALSLRAQETIRNPYNLNIIADRDSYLSLIRKDSLQTLVDLTKTVPGIIPDIRYATDNNFTHKKVYTSARAFARVAVAKALADIQHELSQKGLSLKVFDAYRPYAATLLFWDIMHDTAYVASPLTGSRHNRGYAVDVSIVNLKTGKELVMPTPFDDFTVRANASYPDISEDAAKNRALLITIMSKHGFTVYPSEWWHYDYRGWRDYGLMDLSFEELDSVKSR